MMEKITKIFQLYVLIFITALITNCKKLYNPPATSSSNSYLVVEGVIDPGGDTTTIKLSQTVNLNSNTKSAPVLGAAVIVNSAGGSAYPLIETGHGYYRALLKLNATNKYQLKIAAGGNNYTSDFIPVKNAPVIDTLNYSIQTNGIQINLNTHDATGKSLYYRWAFTETYVLHSAFDSFGILYHTPTDTVIYRPQSQQIYECWPTDTSTTIILGSSAKFTQDVINNQSITQLPSTSEKLADLYSILVKQYTLTVDAYNYYQQLKKNTEQLGSIFDAQPSELTGNIHCTNNPGQVVIGYITAGSYTQKRIFIDSRKLPNWKPDNSYSGCQLDTELFKYYAPNSKTPENQVKEYIYTGFLTPVQAIQPMNSPIVGYSGSTPSCVDCTLRGTNIKPSFWP